MSLFDYSFLTNLNQATGDVQIESPIASPRPNLPQGPIDIGGIQGTVSGTIPSDVITPPVSGTGNVTLDSAITSIQKAAQGMSDWMQQATQNMSTSMQQSASNKGSNWLTNLVLTNRMVSAIIGLIFIAAGLFLFEQTRDIVVSGAKTAAKLAA